MASEFELAVASLEPDQALPDPSETRLLRFAPIEGDYDMCDQQGVITWGTVARSIAEVLTGADYETTVGQAIRNNYTTWDITEDPSIDPPGEAQEEEYAAYAWHSIEIRSPALIYCYASLRAVEDVCAIIASTFCTSSNESTGLHVHIGYGDQGFEFDTVRKLVAFLWAFEPQINSLHPQDRFDFSYCHSMREKSRLSTVWREKFGRRITPKQGTQLILRCQDQEMLLRAVNNFHGYSMAYKFPIFDTYRELKDGYKPTVEFRQHESTMDGKAVTAWVRTVAAMVDFVKTNEENSLVNLFTILEHERWEKVGGSIDVQREKEMGPILAEGEYTIIDLLKVIGAHSAALYYKNRGIHKIQKKVPDDVDDKDRVPDGAGPEDASPSEAARAPSPVLRTLSGEIQARWDALSVASDDTLLGEIKDLQKEIEQDEDQQRTSAARDATSSGAAVPPSQEMSSTLHHHDETALSTTPEPATSAIPDIFHDERFRDPETPPGLYDGEAYDSEWESFRRPLDPLKHTPPRFHHPFQQPLRDRKPSPKTSPKSDPPAAGAPSPPRPRPELLAPLFRRNSAGVLEDTGRRE